LGWKLSFDDLNGDNISDIWITQPHCYTHSGGPDAGAVYIWYGGSTFPKGAADLSNADICIQSSAVRSLLGKSAVSLDFNGDGHVEMLLGAPRLFGQQENEGAAYIVDL
jgi:hypothetical protein